MSPGCQILICALLHTHKTKFSYPGSETKTEGCIREKKSPQNESGKGHLAPFSFFCQKASKERCLVPALAGGAAFKGRMRYHGEGFLDAVPHTVPCPFLSGYLCHTVPTACPYCLFSIHLFSLKTGFKVTNFRRLFWFTPSEYITTHFFFATPCCMMDLIFPTRD